MQKDPDLVSSDCNNNNIAASRLAVALNPTSYFTETADSVGHENDPMTVSKAEGQDQA